MRWLIHYFRQAFCNHSFVQVQTVEYKDKSGFVVKEHDNYICTKCLWVRHVKIK
nr:MAG TPA: RNHCP domain protein [Crassvirales sp.]